MGVTMDTVSKKQLMEMIDKALPEDAVIGLMSAMLYEAFSFNEETMTEMFPKAEDMWDGEDPVEGLENATHILVGQ